MPNEFCDICLNNGRPVKFVSDRIQVCQWCVTLLQNKPFNPQEIEEYLMTIVNKHVRKPPQEPDKNEIRRKAYSHVTTQESFLESIYTSMFSKDKRERKVQELFETIYQRAYSSYKDELIKYKTEIDHEIKDNYKKLLSGEYVPRELTSFFAKRDIFSSRWSSPIRSAYKDSLDSTDKIYLKYIRAYNHYLLSGNDKLSRPDEQTMQELRGSIKRQDGYICKICSKFGKGVELHVHHIIPIDKYGSNHPNNLITLCHSCHNKQHSGFQVNRNMPVTRKITGGDFISIDIETTGFSCVDDEIIEVAAAHFNGGRCLQKYESLMRPRRKEVPQAILNMTGIKAVELETSPSPEDVLPSLVDFIGESKIVGHNIKSFDLPFLVKACERIGIAFPDHDVVDTLTLCREKLDTANHKLQTALDFFRIEAGRNHRAFSDAFATGKLYIELLNYPKIGKTRSANLKREPVQQRSVSKAQIIPCYECGELIEVYASGNQRVGRCLHCGTTNSGPSTPMFYRPKIKGAGQLTEIATKYGEQIASRALKRFACQEPQHWESFLEYLRQGGPDCTEYCLKKVGSKWTVISPSGKVITHKRTKRDASIAAVEAETEALCAAGFPTYIVSCIWAVRIIRSWDPQLFLFEEECAE